MQILILSPHRCGSSACTRLINMMGAHLGDPENLKGPNWENLKGFWENDEVVDLNKLILQRLGGRWDRVSMVTPPAFDGSALDSLVPAARRLVNRLDACRPWATKDPRMCLLMPFWLPLLEMPVCVLMHRHPVEAARSLQRRNNMPLDAGIALWEKHMVDALAATAHLPRILVRYHDLMTGPVQAAQRLAAGLRAHGVSGLRDPDPREITAFLDPALHREHRAPDDDRLLNDPQRALLALFEEANPFDASPPVMSEAGMQALVAYEAQAQADPEPLLSNSRWNMGEIIRVRMQLDDARKETARLAAALAKAEQALVVADQRQRQDSDRHGALEQSHAELQRTCEALAHERQAIQAELDAAGSRQRELEAAHAALEQTHRDLQTAYAALEATHGGSQAALGALTEQHADLTRAYTSLQQEHNRLRAHEHVEWLKAMAALEQRVTEAVGTRESKSTRVLDRKLQSALERHEELRRRHRTLANERAALQKALNHVLGAAAGLHATVEEIARNRWWRLGLRIRLLAGTLGLKSLAPQLPTDQAGHIYRELVAWNNARLEQRRLLLPSIEPAAIADGAPRSPEEYIAHTKDLGTLSGWIDVLFEDIEQMHELWWWQLGLKARRMAGMLRLKSRTPRMPYNEAVKLMARWHELQTEMFRRAAEAATTRAELERDTREAAGVIKFLYDDIARMRTNPWWRLGIRLRTITGQLGLMKKNFRMPTAEADEVIARFENWTPRLAVESTPPSVKPAAPPRAPILSPTTAAAPASLSTVAPGPNSGVFFEYVRALLQTTKNPSLHTALETSEREVAAHAAARRHERTSEPLVSVIMPTFNRAAIIGEAIRSVREQTWQNWELFVCDDGSDDATGAVVSAMADPRIKFLKLDHGGAAKARNAGLARARGDYIAYLDSDNIWHPAYLEVMIGALMRGAGRYAAYAKYLDVVIEKSGRLRIKHYHSREFNYERLSEKNFVDLNTFVHRAELYQQLGGFTDHLPRCQDWDLALKYCFLRDPLYVDAFLAYYRRNRAWKQLTHRLKELGEGPAQIVQENLQSHYINGLPRIQTSKRRRKVTVLSWDICRNHFSKAYNLAEALHREGGHEVQLVGFRFFENAIFEPYAGESPPFQTRYFEGSDFPAFEDSFARAVMAADGDIIYCVKPRLPSLGAALLANYHFGVPVALESNDFEAVVTRPLHGDEMDAVGIEDVNLTDPDLLVPHSGLWSRIMDKLALQLPVIVTHNKNLDAHYGNRAFYMRNLKDEQHYDPALYDREAIRRQLGFATDDRIILFGGLIRKHKGIYDIVELVQSLGGAPYKALFVGSRVSPDQERLARKYRDHVQILPPQGRNYMAQVNLAADVVILWLDPNIPASQYQMPYKLTDALAMHVPVIANDISDLGLLGRQGYLRLVPYGDFEGLREAVREVCAPSERRDVMVAQARRLYLRQFSYRAAAANFELICSHAARVQPPLAAAEQFAQFYSRFHEALRAANGVPA
jgi:glycosyltransferase involved in cell wall biosynthesis